MHSHDGAQRWRDAATHLMDHWAPAGERASDLRGISEGTAPGISQPASPRDEGDRDTVGFQAARREIDNERPTLAGATIFEPRRRQFDVRRRQGAGLRIGVAEGAMDKGHEVAPNKRGIFLGETGAKITIATTSEQELGLVSGCLLFRTRSTMGSATASEAMSRSALRERCSLRCGRVSRPSEWLARAEVSRRCKRAGADQSSRRARVHNPARGNGRARRQVGSLIPGHTPTSSPSARRPQ
jgi:hypothetical protein